MGLVTRVLRVARQGGRAEPNPAAEAEAAQGNPGLLGICLWCFAQGLAPDLWM